MRSPTSIDRLLRLDDAAAPLLVDDAREPMTWFERDSWRVYAPPVAPDEDGGEPVAWFAAGGERRPLVHDAVSGRTQPPFAIDAAYETYVLERWMAQSPVRHLSNRQLNTFYRVKPLIPRSAQLAARRLLIEWQGLPRFPAWPVDLSVARLIRFYAFCVLLAQRRQEATFDWFWPDRYTSALILTHDVETAEGLALALELADVEEERGFRSSFNLGAWYDVDPGLIEELTQRGFEVGIHGLRHDRSLFESRASFEAQLPSLRALAERFDARGFRSPATHRVVDWIAELPVDYDCSVPHSDPFEPQPGGCCSLWPYFIGGVVELPYTLPQDHLVFTLLRHDSPRVWIEQAARIEHEYGLIQCLSHPDPSYLGNRKKRAFYAEFLDALAERPRVWKALPRDVAAWWRDRDSGSVSPAQGTVAIGSSPDEVELRPPDERDAAAEAGASGAN
jgi:peptidoglycan/xylan/chitin deacetylase (PgdA/CDA1 family)